MYTVSFWLCKTLSANGRYISVYLQFQQPGVSEATLIIRLWKLALLHPSVKEHQADSHGSQKIHERLGDLLWSMQLWKMNLARNAHLLQSFLRHCEMAGGWTFGHKYSIAGKKGRNNRETKTFQAALQPIYFQYITHFTRLFHFSGTQYARNISKHTNLS